MKTLFSLRAQLLSAGYSPLPNFDKRCLVKGWNRDFLTKQAKRWGTLEKAIERWDERFPDYTGTGVLIKDGLLALDADVDDEELSNRLADIINKISPEVFERAPIRYGSGKFKTAWFCRLDGKPFNRRGTHKYSRPDELAAYRARVAAAKADVEGTDRKRPRVELPAYHHVEFFGGKVSDSGVYSRQFGCYGPNKIDSKGAVVASYEWAGASLYETPIGSLPLLTTNQIYDILCEFEKAAVELGWEAHSDEAEAETADQFAYDIDRATAVFELEDYETTVGYDDLEAIYDRHPRAYCTPSFINDISSTYRCTLGWSNRHDCVVVMDWKTGVSHLPKDVEPIDVPLEAIAAAIKDMAARTGTPIKECYTQKEKLKIEDFCAFLPTHQYIYMPDTTGKLWVRSSIDAYFGSKKVGTKLKKVKKGEPPATEPVKIPTSLWLDRNMAVTSITWAPGMPQLIYDRMPGEGGWVEKNGAVTFNLYRGPDVYVASDKNAQRWVDFVRFIYGDYAGHIILFFAHCVQRPGVKINHALVLAGAPGIGKDTMLEPLKRAVGTWNFKEVSPHHIGSSHNDFMKNVVLRVSEARDLGEVDRYKFYEATKTIIAAPPDTVRVNTKYVPEYYLPNVCAVIFTTNYPADGLFLPPNDRRHYVAGTAMLSEQFDPSIWDWYADGGIEAVIAYLATLSLDGFDAKASPTKTPAFWRMVNSGRPVEESELRDVIEAAKAPDAFTVASLLPFMKFGSELKAWVLDRKNARNLSRRFDDCGYVPVKNPAADDARWRIGATGKKHTIYAKSTLNESEQLKVAIALRDAEGKIMSDETLAAVLEELKNNNIIPFER